MGSGRYEEAAQLMKLIESRFATQEIDRSLDNPVNYLVLENISGGLTLADYILNKNPSIPNLLGCLIQLSTALEMALKRFDFCHYDLHTRNILMRFIGGPQMLARIGNKRQFIPIGYGKDDGSRYFIESDYIPTIIDFGRSHVQYTNPISGKTKHYGYHHAMRGGVYPDQSRPAYDLFKLLGFLSRDLFARYDPRYIKDLRQLRDSPGEDDETHLMAKARRVFRYIPEAIIDFVIKLFMFFPFFKRKYGAVIHDPLRLRIILSVYMELDTNKFDINTRWPEADMDPFKQDVHESFYTHLRVTFPTEVEQILWTRDSLPNDAYVFSCDFQNCPN